MAPQPTGSWKTGSGLLDDFDFTIEEAWFGVNEKFGDTLLLNLRGIAEQEGEVVDDEHVLLYSTGEGWEATKGGREAAHTAGKTTFVNNTNMGRLINAMVGLGDEVIKELQSRGDTFVADTWEGLQVHIERKQFSYRDRETKEQVTYEVPLPVDFIGTVEVEESKPAPKKGPAKGATKKTPAKAKAEEVEEAEEAEEAPAKKTPAKKGTTKKTPAKKGNAALRAAIVNTGTEYDFENHSDFVNFIFDPEQFDEAEALSADEELSAEALDEESSLWAEVQAAE
jgi:hypothetical protein